MREISVLLLLLGSPLVRAGTSVPLLYRIETVAGTSGNGDGGPALAAQMGTIQGIAVDSAGNLYLADTDNHRIRKVTAAGTISTLAGTGVAGFSGDGGPATSARLNLPYGLAVDWTGAVYVADLGNNRVRRIGADGVITTVAGTGAHASAGDGGLATAAQLSTPRNVAVDSTGNLYISEFEGHRVRKVTPDGKIASLAGTGIAGFRGDGGPAISALICYPAGLAVDRSGNVYIADSGNNRVRQVQGSVITTVLPPASAALATPVAVAVDPLGSVYTIDGGTSVHAFTAAGKWIDSFAGSSVAGFSGDGGPASKASLVYPRDLAADPYGNLYIADGPRVRKVDSKGNIQTVAGDGYLHAVGDGSAATSAVLVQPSSVGLDSGGNLYIADPGTERVRLVSPSGTIVTLAGTGTAGVGTDQVAASSSPLNAPMGVAVDASGNVLIADTNNHRVRKVGVTRVIANLVGTGAAGIGPDLQAPLSTPLHGPKGVCVDRSGTVYVVDTSNHRVLRVPPTGLAETLAGSGSSGSGGDGGQAKLAQLNQPSACSVDSFGNVFVADTLNHRIRKVTPPGVITTVAGTGDPGSTGDEGPATSARLQAPCGVAVTDSGDIFIADTGNHRIRQITPDGVIHTIAGQGSAGWSGDGGSALTALLNAPQGLVLDGSGAIYLADTGNNRVRRLVVDSGAPISPSGVVIPAGGLSVVNAASLVQGPVAPGEIVSIYGTGIGPAVGVTGTFDAGGNLATKLGDAEVRFDGIAAPLIYSQTAQIAAQVPYSVAGKTTTHLEVSYQGNVAGAQDVPVAASVPGVFAVAFNQDGSANSTTNPAARGTTVTFLATGEGLTDGANQAGQAATAPAAHPKLAVTLKIASLAADIVDASSGAGQVGTLQVVARVPATAAAGKAGVELTVGGVVAPAVSVWLK